MRLYTTKELAAIAGVSIRTIQRACLRAGITRRPLVIQGETERKAVLNAIPQEPGTKGNANFGQYGSMGGRARWDKQK